jgi:cyanophycin synthetase
VVLQQGQLVLAEGSSTMPLAGLSQLTQRRNKNTQDDKLLCSVLAAVAAAWALDISPDLIAAGLKTFELDPGSTRPVKSLAAR